MIRTEGLTKRFNNILAVDNLTLEVRQGEVFGFLGPNGAGKTTTVRLLTSLIAPTAGTAWVNDHQLGVADDAVRASAGILTETPGLYPRLNAEQNLRLFARLYSVDDAVGQVNGGPRHELHQSLGPHRRHRPGVETGLHPDDAVD